MKKTSILVIGLILILILLAASLLALTSYNLLSPSYSNISSYTKAICNSENFCQDYEVKCENSNIRSITSITGASVQFSPTWKDKRDENTKNEMCYN